jgi:DNA topoisomerase III
MGKALIIAEKPSVAADIAKALGGFSKTKENYYESERFILSSAVGHLLELAVPEGHEAKKGKWNFANLPVIPPYFDLKPIEKSEDRLRLLLKLLKNKEVDSLINACDAGREGELIFRYIVKYSKSTKPIQRLWLQSMTAAAIREGFAGLRRDADMLPLADAAVCRSESDWLVGINGTRVLTAFNSKGGGFNKTTVGRVQTPTLAILVEREERIKRFVSRTYWELHGHFTCAAGEYVGRWFDEQFVKPATNGKDIDDGLRAERIWDQAKAEAIKTKCVGKPGIVTEESKPTTQLSPLLYDLTSLQRDANRRFGFSAQRTLSIAQALYERFKVLTYPRTDSRHLPEDYLGTVRGVMEMLVESFPAPPAAPGAIPSYGLPASTILRENWIHPNKRIFNNAKISDHFAIIPTNVRPDRLGEAEQKIYDMVARRFLAIFYPPAEHLVTTRITRVESEPFKSEGKVLVKAGWLEVYGKDASAETNDEAGANLVPVQQSEQVNTRDIEIKQEQTKPPARFSEATLLGAMEGAGKLVEDDELREAMAEKGLGTPATRAQIIEGLIYEDYVHRVGRDLTPTGKAFMLLALLRGLGIPELSKPELTGDWEFKLRQIEHGRLSRNEFMAEIAEAARHIVERTKQFQGDEVPGDFGELQVPCPKCGGLLKENYRWFQCVKCDFSLPKFLSSRLMDHAEVEQLIRERTLGPLQGFRSRKGFPFAAILKLSAEHKLEFDFGNSNGENGDGKQEPIDFTGKEPLGTCPKCGGRVFENGMNYICEHGAPQEKKCDFRTGKIILQQTIEPAQITKLLATGKTDLLDKFVSKKNNRAFKAFLALDKTGKIGFEFEKRTKAPKGAKKEPPVKVDFTGQQPIGKCPRCGGKVFQSETAYLCENSQAEKKPCKFKCGKTILQQPVELAQIAKLLESKKSDLLQKFVSNKTGRTFPAWLVLDEDGKVGFEFPEREAQSGGN